MSRPRGGGLETRRNRAAECICCKKGIRASDAAQMLRFNYLCAECHERGCSLALVAVPGAHPPRKTVRIIRDGTVAS